MVIKGQFECSFCHSDHCASEECVKPAKLGPNKQFKKMIEDSGFLKNENIIPIITS
jgi:hypothetical protein